MGSQLDSFSTQHQIKLLFVCMGNICRSPMAKWIMQDICDKHGVAAKFELDSCGTGDWHAGEGADPRSAKCGASHRLNIEHVARQITRGDVQTFDLILAMDRANLRDVLSLGASRTKVRLIREFDPLLKDVDDRDREVPDPYYGGEQGFEMMYEMLKRACEGLFATLQK